MKKSSKNLIFVSIFFCTVASTFAQLKIGYIQSERIRTEYEEFTEAESQLQMEYQKVQVEYEKMIMHYHALSIQMSSRKKALFAICSQFVWEFMEKICLKAP